MSVLCCAMCSHLCHHERKCEAFERSHSFWDIFGDHKTFSFQPERLYFTRHAFPGTPSPSFQPGRKVEPRLSNASGEGAWDAQQEDWWSSTCLPSKAARNYVITHCQFQCSFTSVFNARDMPKYAKHRHRSSEPEWTLSAIVSWAFFGSTSKISKKAPRWSCASRAIPCNMCHTWICPKTINKYGYIYIYVINI